MNDELTNEDLLNLLIRCVFRNSKGDRDLLQSVKRGNKELVFRTGREVHITFRSREGYKYALASYLRGLW